MRLNKILLASSSLLHAIIFFFMDTPTTDIYPLTLHSVLPICCPAWRPPRGGTATAAAARAVARASSTAVTQAACSWRTRAGEQERSIGPVDGPAPLIADLASFRQVSDPKIGRAHV